jgi:protein O-GlcNAc transferase
MTLHRQGRIADAAKIYQALLLANPNNVEALHLLGVVALQTGQAQRGVDLISRAVTLKPDHAEAQSNLGNGYRALARPTDAIAAYDRALAINPRLIDAHSNRGLAVLDLGDAASGLKSFEAALSLNPKNANALCNRGTALQMLKRTEEALESFTRATAIQPNLAEAHLNSANVLLELGRPQEALASAERAGALQPQRAEPSIARGNALLALHRPSEALTSFDAALAYEPHLASALIGRGRALLELDRAADALSAFDAALARHPEAAELHAYSAIALLTLRRNDDALERANRAIAIDVAFNSAYLCRANVFLELGRLEDALRDFEHLAAVAPNTHYLLGHYVHTKMSLCAWDGLEPLIARLIERTEAGARASYPFPLLDVTDRTEILHKCAMLQAETELPASGVSAPLRGGRSGGKIKVAYFSSDFSDHPVTHLIAGTLASHDRSRFEVFGCWFGRRSDAFTDRVRHSVDHFIDMSRDSVPQIVNAIRAAEIDIAIDLNGYTKNARTGVFASRTAPVQMSYLGYLGTMGAPFMDYLIADRVLIPLEQRRHYSEKLILLPWYQCNDETANSPDGLKATRAAYGLPENAFVFCTFNSSFKITPEVFDIWMRLLKRTPGSVIWLFAGRDSTAANLRAAAQERGVAPERLIFARRVDRAEHLARQRLADLMLDTFPYNGGATTSNALRAGVPVLTRAGQSFASRMSASLLSALNLPELVAASAEAYEETAAQLAAKPQALTALRLKLVAAPTSDLFSAAAFTRHLEHGYEQAVARSRARLAPEDIVV